MGRLLEFKAAIEPIPLSREEASTVARSFFSTPNSARSSDAWSSLVDADVLFALISILRDEMNRSPLAISEEAARIHDWISKSRVKVGMFDERDYFLGELSLIAGVTFRHLGEFDAAEKWLELAEASFRHTLNPAPLAARVSYARLSIRFDQRQLERVLEGVPSLLVSFDRLGMPAERRKTQFLEAMSLKQVGENAASLASFEALRMDLPSEDSALLSRVLIEIGAEHARVGRFEEAVSVYGEAADLLSTANDPMPLAHLKGTIAETYRLKGELHVAVDCYRVAMAEFARLGMETTVAYDRILVAEVLLMVNRDREAEWEIAAALPVVESHNMIPDAVVAVGLLRESVKRRNTDRGALRDLREKISQIA